MEPLTKSPSLPLLSVVAEAEAETEDDEESDECEASSPLPSSPIQENGNAVDEQQKITTTTKSHRRRGLVREKEVWTRELWHVPDRAAHNAFRRKNA